MLIVFGLVAFDNALTVHQTFPNLFPHHAAVPGPVTLVRALLVPTTSYDTDRILGFRDAIDRLQRKSRSFFLASSVFSGRLRQDLILL